MKLRAMHLWRLLAVAAATAAVAGCGQSKGSPIPRSQASDILARLQEAQRRSNAHACHDLRSNTIPALQSQVAALPQSVDANVRATLSDGVSHLNDLVQQQCATQTQTTTTPTTTTPTTPTLPTTTTPTQTVPTQTQTTTTPRTTTTTTPHTTPTATTPHTTTSPGGVTPPQGPGGHVPPGQAKKGKGGD